MITISLLSTHYAPGKVLDSLQTFHSLNNHKVNYSHFTDGTRGEGTFKLVLQHQMAIK